MAAAYRHLLAPGRIGTLALRNRILMCPMGDNQATAEGYVTDQQIAYFEARAQGGAALLIVGSVGVTAPDGLSSPRQAALANESMVAGFARMAERVHAHGAKLALQLVHNGKNAVMDIVAGRPMLVPSHPKASPPDALMGMLTPDEAERMGTPGQVKGARVAYHEMTREDIAHMAERHADTAELARRAGIDAIEIHAGHGYLIDTFLSPTTNHRTDEYGGPVENRARFLVEVLTAIRRRVGRDFPVWCRINGEEFFVAGQTLPEACRVAELAEAAGADAIHVSSYADPARAIGFTEAHSTHTPGRFLEHAAAVKQRVRIPVIAVGRIDPELAESTIAAGRADFVAMGRKLIADPELPNKLMRGAREDVRPCLYHYRCISQIFVSSSIACAVNAFTGREAELKLTPAAVAKRVLVVGGGPAGLEAARLAAMRGHRVTLVEAQETLGGRFRHAAATSDPNAELLRWLEGQVRKLPIEIRLGRPWGASEIAAEGFDAVLVATGARWTRPGIPGSALPQVHDIDGLGPWLAGTIGRADEALVVLGGDKPGLALAGVARRRGAKAVTVLEASNVFAQSNGVVGRWRYVHEAREAGIALEGGAQVVAIEPEQVVWRDAAGETRSTAAQRVLVVTGAAPDEGFVRALGDVGVAARAIGDCRALGRIEGAMRDATESVLAL
jgi:2,4-dienoyl-CoA reductase-like NADH-dependent reductase (Old Yellow Enzyme family)/thioredoxin reductase